jgi:NAD(P)-dependent dehydrogenase (short-subunit alcohol dehydrogenase family)
MPRTVLITGAGSGFGRMAASQLAQRGHKVIATVLNDQQAAELSKAEPKLTVAKLDITKDVAAVDQWDPDVFIANAAIGQTGPLSLIPLERLRAVFEVNVFATFAVTQRVAQKMRKKRAGRIIIMSSIGGVRAGVGSGPYTMTKHAIQAFGTALRAELKMFGVDVCTINPGPYATGFNDRMAKNPGDWFDRKTAAPEDVAVMDQLVQRITVGQLDPVDVAKRYVELVEADKTELVNFVPPDIVERMSKSMPAR